MIGAIICCSKIRIQGLLSENVPTSWPDWYFYTYTLQSDLINDRPYYKKDTNPSTYYNDFYVWWCGEDEAEWWIGRSGVLGKCTGQIHLKRDVQCPIDQGDGWVYWNSIQGQSHDWIHNHFNVTCD